MGFLLRICCFFFASVENVSLDLVAFGLGFLAALGYLWRELARSLALRLLRWALRFSEFVLPSLS